VTQQIFQTFGNDVEMETRFLSLRRLMLLGSLFFAAGALSDARAEDRPFITVASTTSAEQSGLLGYLLPMFTRTSGIEVFVASIGTGQALKSGEFGECDVVLVHDKAQELPFMQSGFGIVRREVMYDDFVLVGPKDDPAKIDATRDAVAALRKIAEARALFVSRGDMSGTDAAEKRFWTEAGRKPTADRDLWYVETGSSMEQTLATAAARNGYTLTDRGTWLKFNNRANLKIVVEGDRRLINHYAVILVNPAQHPQVKADLGMAFVEWLTSRDGQAAIAGYKVDGEPLFFPEHAAPYAAFELGAPLGPP
jgi:tungstate transport system substrate-binding protein